MLRNDVEVRWEMATDENFDDVVQSGTEIAAAHQAHSVHVAHYGLEPARYYWYRFKAGDEISVGGRTKTPLAPGVPLGAMSFAFASCADYQEGYFPAYRVITEEEALDLILHPTSSERTESSWTPTTPTYAPCARRSVKTWELRRTR